LFTSDRPLTLPTRIFNWSKFSNTIRKSLTRLRISTHTLEIERGRYKKLKREEWLCKACLKIEDEPHFLLDCNLFKINNDKIRLFMEKEVGKYKAVHSIENDSNSVILLPGSAQIPSTVQWEITLIVQCWNSYRALQIKET
jgi:hypothetical protein